MNIKVYFAVRRSLSATPFIYIFLFLVVPMLVLLRLSFVEGALPSGGGFTFQHYQDFFADPYYLGLLGNTLYIGFVTSVISLFLGFPVAYSMARLNARKRLWRLLIVIVPLLLSIIVLILGWLIILGKNGLLNSILYDLNLIKATKSLLFNETAVILVLIQQYIPFMIISIMTNVMHVDPVLERAASSLRADRLTTFTKIIIPLCMPGIFSGFILVFILTVAAYITPRIIGGGKVGMLGSFIYQNVMITLNWPLAAAAAIVLILTTMAIVKLMSAGISRYFGVRL